MPKILSQGGRTLADQYDVEGSVAGIDNLDSRDVHLAHNMADVLFSERFRVSIRVAGGTVAQSTGITLSVTNPAPSVGRLLGVAVYSDDATRISDGQISCHANLGSVNDIPVWVWSGNSVPARIMKSSVLTLFDYLVPEVGTVTIPNFTGGVSQGPNPPDAVTFRGISTAFGAGTVDIFFIAHIAFNIGAVVTDAVLGSKIPSW